LGDLEILTCLAHGLADEEKPVRLDAALAIAQFGSEQGAPLLRLKVLLGDKEPEVVGQCFASLLSLAPRASLPFVREFLSRGDEDVVAEAASVLAASREPEAIEILRRFWKTKASREVRRAILISLGASPLKQAADFLLAVLSEESDELATQALAALAASRFHAEMREGVRLAVEAKGNAELSRTFERRFPK
jgi:HEAT repeat protein